MVSKKPPEDAELKGKIDKVLSQYPALRAFHDINIEESRFGENPTLELFVKHCNAATLKALNDNPRVLALFSHGEITEDEFVDEIKNLLVPAKIERAAKLPRFLEVIYNAMDNTKLDRTKEAAKMALGLEDAKMEAFAANPGYLHHLNTHPCHKSYTLVTLAGNMHIASADEIRRTHVKTEKEIQNLTPPTDIKRSVTVERGQEEIAKKLAAGLPA